MKNTCLPVYFLNLCFTCTFVVISATLLKPHDDIVAKERLLQAKEIASYMDQSVNPCEDFEQYACGNYPKIHKDTLNKDSFITGSGNAIDFLHGVLMEEVNESVSSEQYSASDKARMYYQSCMKADIFKFPKSEAYLKIVDSLGGWPALKSKWKKKDFNWYNFTVTAKSYDVDIFLTEYFESDQYKINFKCFGVLHCIYPLKPHSRATNIMKAISLKLMKMYGVPLYTARRTLKQILEFGRKYSAFFKGQTNSPRATFIDLNDYISVVFNGTEKVAKEKVIVNAVKLKRVSRFLKGKERVAANYAVLKLLSGLHTEFASEQNKKQFCYNQLKNLGMEPLLILMFLQNAPEQKRIDDEVRTLVQVIKSAYSESIKKATWLGNTLKRQFVHKLFHMEAIIGIENLEADERKFDDQFANLNFRFTNDFYENALLARNFLLIYKHTESIASGYYSGYTFEPNAYYYKLNNTLIVLIGFLQKPHYYPDMPSSYNFAKLGYIIAHEIGHGYDIGSILSEENQMDWDIPAKIELVMRVKCLINQYGRFKIKEINEQVNGSISINENIADNIGLRQAFIAYKKWLKMYEGIIDEEKETLNGLALSKYQLFFVSYAQNFCAKLSRKHLFHLKDDIHGLNRHRLIGSISNFDQFAESFGCPVDSPMNPKEKCIIF